MKRGHGLFIVLRNIISVTEAKLLINSEIFRNQKSDKIVNSEVLFVGCLECADVKWNGCFLQKRVLSGIKTYFEFDLLAKKGLASITICITNYNFSNASVLTMNPSRCTFAFEMA